MEEIEQDRNEWEGLLCSLIGRINIVKMSKLKKDLDFLFFHQNMKNIIQKQEKQP